MLAYHFAATRLRDGRAYPQDGATLTQCVVHAVPHPLDGLPTAPSDTLCRVRLGGRVSTFGGIYTAAEFTVLRRVDAGPLLADFARQCALACADTWLAPRSVLVALESGRGPPAHAWRPVALGLDTPAAHGVRCATAAFNATAAPPGAVAPHAWQAAMTMQLAADDPFAAHRLQAAWLQAHVDLAFQLQ